MNFKQLASLLLAGSLSLSLFTGSALAATIPTVKTPAKNVILLIPDGQSLDASTLARWYKGAPLASDELVCGLVRTYSADSAIADSAPAGTAMATGFKSRTGYIGVLGEQYSMPGLTAIDPADAKRPVANILEAARLSGRATGLVASSEIMHATPAAFSSHGPDRKDYDSLSEQQVYQGIDVVLGSGSKFLNEARADGENLLAELPKLGYQYITSPAELSTITSGKVFGLFGAADLAYDFDRDPAKQPSLAEMTKKSIELLSQDPDGFFLMVEGSKVDWAAHANDPVGVISDTLSFDAALAEALAFAKKDGNTVVISASDHGNGGISIGNANTNSSYDKLHIDHYLDPLKRATLTGEGVETQLNASRSNITEVMGTYYGITDLTAAEISAIKTAEAGTLNYTIGPMISRRASIGWTTTGHTGEEVPLYVYAPKGMEIKGLLENTDIAKYMEACLGLNLAETSKQLFLPARAAFEAKGATVSWNTVDPQNPCLEVTQGATKITLPVNKNLAIVNGETVSLPGLVVYNGQTSFVPAAAVELLN